MEISNSRVSIMGILNVTPDSFSDGGKYSDSETAIARAMRIISDGADIIDVGGESTRPGYEPVSAEEEIARVVPVIRGIRERLSEINGDMCAGDDIGEASRNHDFRNITISIDTTKYEVAAAAVEAGATMINDIWGLKKDERLASLAAENDINICLMHNSGRIIRADGFDSDTADSGQASESTEKATEAEMYLSDDMDDAQSEAYMSRVCDELKESVAIAEKHGVSKEKIILDPGVGFHKTYAQDICVIRNISRIVKLGFPVLMAASRKRVVGHTLNLPVDERVEGSIAIALYAASQGCRLVRVHDVTLHARALRMWEGVAHSLF